MKRVQAPTHQQVLKEALKQRRFRRGYAEELEKLHLIEALIALRKRQGLTQAALAHRLGVSQPFIAKLEHAETHSFTLDTLIKFVQALNGELTIHLRPRRRTTASA